MARKRKSRTTRTAPRPARTVPPAPDYRGALPWLYLAAAVLFAAGLTALVVLFGGTIVGMNYRDLLGDHVEDAPVAMTPAGLLIVGFIVLGIAEGIRKPPRRDQPRWIWLLIPVALWAWLALSPAVVQGLGGPRYITDVFWELCGIYGFIAAAAIGVMLIAQVRATPRETPSRRLAAAARFHVDGLLGGVGIGMVGIVPLIAAQGMSQDEAIDVVAVAVVTAIGAVLAASGVVIALNAPTRRPDRSPSLRG